MQATNKNKAYVKNLKWSQINQVTILILPSQESLEYLARIRVVRVQNLITRSDYKEQRISTPIQLQNTQQEQP